MKTPRFYITIGTDSVNAPQSHPVKGFTKLEDVIAAALAIAQVRGSAYRVAIWLEKQPRHDACLLEVTRTSYKDTQLQMQAKLSRALDLELTARKAKDVRLQYLANWQKKGVDLHDRLISNRTAMLAFLANNFTALEAELKLSTLPASPDSDPGRVVSSTESGGVVLSNEGVAA
jgi:hypothetical protein